MTEINDIRNIVLLGHGSSGKTTLVEAILHKTGVTTRLGTVEEKTTVCDFDDEEKERGHSIRSTIVNTSYKNKHLNLIDSPGYPGFIGPALQGISAAETAVIVIDATAGIEVNTRKHFEAAQRDKLATVFVINKIDSDNTDYPELVSNIQKAFGSNCKCANLPSNDKKTVIDCITSEQGDSFMSISEAHTELVESIIEADDGLMEAYLSGEQIPRDKIASVFMKAIVGGNIIPILFTNARTEIGIQELLDFIVTNCPSPVDGVQRKLKSGDNEIELKADPSGPLAGVVFKIGIDPKSHMKYAYIRIFSGTLHPDTHMLRDHDKKSLRPGHILQPQAANPVEITEGIAGNIICLAKIEELKYGDIIHDGKVDGKLELPQLPNPMFSLALEPASRGDETKIGTALEKLCEEDPCFTAAHNKQTKELVINGIGDLHLRIMLGKLEHNYKIKVNTKPPKIPYRETISAKADGHHRHKKQSGGAGQFGEVYLRVEPGERGQQPTLSTSWDVFGGSIPSQFEAPIIKGIQDVMETGFIAGYPLQDIKVSIYDGKHHPVDSKEVAFRAAGKGAFLDALSKAKPVLLEPVVHLEITVPAECMGDITSDIAGRRGRIQGQDMLAGNMMVIKAQAPLSEVTSYNSQLKSMTGGQGSYSMELSHYEPVPPNVQQTIAAQYEKERTHEE